jgi:hypothetical protein
MVPERGVEKGGKDRGRVWKGMKTGWEQEEGKRERYDRGIYQCKE